MALSAFLPAPARATQDNTYTAADSDGDSGTCNQSDTNVLVLIFIREYQAQADDPVSAITLTYSGDAEADLGTNVYLRDSVGALLDTDNDGTPYTFSGSWSEAEYRVHADIAADATIGNHVDFSIAIGDITDIGDGNAVTEIIDIDSRTIVAVANNAPILGYTASNVLGGAVQRTDGTGKVDIFFRVQDADGAADISTFTTTSAGGGVGVYNSIADTSVSFAPDGDFTPATDWSSADITTITWNSKVEIPSADSSNAWFRFKVFDGDDPSAYGAITGFTVDNVTPTITTPVYFDPLPDSSDANFTLRAIWTESSVATPQFGYQLNGGAWSGWENGTSANDSQKTWNVGVDGDDKFNLIRSTYTDAYGNTCHSLSEDTDIFVRPLVPAAPTVDNPSATTLDVTINKNGSESGSNLYYVIKATYNSTVKYVKADGSLGDAAVWQTTTTWGETVIVGGLSEGTTYWFSCAAGNPQDSGTTFTSGNSSSTFSAASSEYAAGEAQNWDSRVVLPCTLVWAVPDVIPPASISNLTALSSLAGPGGRVQLKWTAPGDDGAGGGDVLGYKVKYATKYIAASDFYESWVSTYAQSWEPASAGTEESRILTGFEEGTTYWFAVIARDDVPYWSVWTGTSTDINALSYSVPSDSAPATITNLSALTGSSEGEIDLTWTAPGDDGTTGNITNGKWKIKYSTISSIDWNTGVWNDFDDKYEMLVDTTADVFSSQSRTMTGLHQGVTYYFRMAAGDEKPNWSGLSNSATAWAQMISDNTAPAAITALSASTYTLTGQVKLEWQSPGDDGWSEDLPSGSSFTIQYATFTSVSWSTASAQIVINASGISTGTVVSTTTLLSRETTYYFRIWTNDEIPNYSDISYGATIWCRIAPSAVTTLSALALDDGTGDVKLIWVAPGDDGTTGNISDGQWKIKWSTISSVDWDTGDWDDYDNKCEVLLDTTSVSPLSEQTQKVTGLHGNVTYYFRLWARDENTGVNAPGNWSEISNASTSTVVAVIGITVSSDSYNFGVINISSKGVSGSTITVTNDGNVSETYSLEVASVTLADGSYSYWKATNTTVGHNRFMVYSVFHGVQVSTENFQSEDIVTEASQASDGANIFTVQGGGGDQQYGNNVPKGEGRKVRFRLDMPTSLQSEEAEKIKVTISAAEASP